MGWCNPKLNKQKQFDILNETFKTRNIKKLRWLLKNYTVIDLNQELEGKETPIHFVVRHNLVEFAELIIDYGVNINVKGTEDGVTPLHMACLLGYKDMINLLIERSADVRAVDTISKNTPLHYCISKNSTLSVPQKIDIMKALLEANAEIDAQNWVGETALLAACKENNEAIITLLLQYHADCNLSDHSDVTPLHVVSGFQILSIVKLLLSKHANLTCDRVKGKTPFHFASFSESFDVLQLLYDCDNTLFHKKDHLGNTAFHDACCFNATYEKIAWFIDHHALLDAKNHQGCTPLHCVLKFN